jgi:hypothetical protein
MVIVATNRLRGIFTPSHGNGRFDCQESLDRAPAILLDDGRIGGNRHTSKHAGSNTLLHWYIPRLHCRVDYSGHVVASTTH